MREYDFEIIISGPENLIDLSQPASEKISEAIGYDGTLGQCQGETGVMFTREAESFESAVFFAIEQLLAVPRLTIEQIESDEEPENAARMSRILKSLSKSSVVQ